VPTDEIQRFECDSVILAVGETFDVDFAKASGLQLKEPGTIVVNRFTLETSRPRFYAGGDVITGASNVSNAMAYGKQVARSIDESLMGSKRWPQLLPQFEYERAVPEQTCESRRHQAGTITIGARRSSYDEVVMGLGADEALDESDRCLRCDVKTATVS
jgi:NADH-quinone oxidoreductase subunit F